MHKHVLALSFILLSACAQQPGKPDLLPSQVHKDPVCEGEQQCSAMWGRAIEGASIVTRMKVMTVTDAYIQTFPTRKIGFLNGQVFKQKLDGDKYLIRGVFNCDPYDWCLGFKNRTQDTFNSYVQGFDPIK
ncbi:hypothetical protein [Pseudomonas aeruginosa]|uniref:hypothetical protein n=2 Tax=Pseudomonas aeruginosa TaxID=287 RepID=UPI001181C55E|nr:hypothetical protein [Pseudomonas aeruginosa]